MKLVYQPSAIYPALDPITAAFFWRSKADRLLKMDLDIHRVGVVDALSGSFPTLTPESEERIASRNPLLINDDNDDLDPACGVSPHPQDNDDGVLKLREPFTGKRYDDDDVVLVTLRKFDAVTTGRIRLTSSSNDDIRFFKYEEDEYLFNEIAPSELVIDLSNPDPDSPLKNLPSEDVSFYIEGRTPNADLAVQMIFEDSNGDELARQEVNIEIKPTRIINLSVQGNGQIAEATVKSNLTDLVQGANIIRRDRDWLDSHADVMVPVTFRIGNYLGVDADPNHSSWSTTSSGSDEGTDILNYAESNGIDIYLVSVIQGAGGFAISGRDGMVVPVQRNNNDVVAHEWLHAYGDTKTTIGDANSDGHICIDKHLMEGSGCSGSLNRGSDVRESEKLLFQIY